MKPAISFILSMLAAFALPAQSIFDSTYIVGSAEIYFASGRAELTAEASVQLDSLAVLALRQPQSAGIRVMAHTDSLGSGGANEQLAARRGAAVRQLLVRRGIPAENIRIAAFGERRPQADNTTEAGRQRNRRATVEVSGSIPMTALSGQIKDRATGQGVESVLTFRSKTRQDSARTDSAGHYSVRLPKDSLVKIDAVAPDYFFETTVLRLFGSPELYKKHKISPDIELAPAKPGATAVVRDLFFVGDQAVLLKRSEPELPKILRFMQLNPDLRVEIAGHINKPGVPGDKLEKWEWNLSFKRAEVVYYYLLRNGIPADRLTYKGYGNTQMLFPDAGASAVQQEQNRRVEVRILETN